MLSLIGGMMLSCAVGAMILLALWSLARDEDPDTVSRDGILALRDWSARTLERAQKRAQKRTEKRQPSRTLPAAAPQRQHARPAAARRAATAIDRDEMESIRLEIEEAEFRREFGGGAV